MKVKKRILAPIVPAQESLTWGKLWEAEGKAGHTGPADIEEDMVEGGNKKTLHVGDYMKSLFKLLIVTLILFLFYLSVRFTPAHRGELSVSRR